MKTIRLFALVAVGLSCSSPRRAPTGPATPITYFTARYADTRFHTADHMLASIEMQVSGEPFAELLDRNLEGYNRFLRETDIFTDPDTGEQHRDPLGYATAVESYEYSKFHMNMLSFESGAGMSLMFGPLLNSSNVKGEPAFELLVNRLQHLADLSHASARRASTSSSSPRRPPPAQRLRLAGLLAADGRMAVVRPDHRAQGGLDARLQLRGGLRGGGDGPTDRRRLRVQLQLAQFAQS